MPVKKQTETFVIKELKGMLKEFKEDKTLVFNKINYA